VKLEDLAARIALHREERDRMLPEAAQLQARMSELESEMAQLRAKLYAMADDHHQPVDGGFEVTLKERCRIRITREVHNWLANEPDLWNEDE
jgi:uncharacterized protein YhaN